MEKGDKQIGFFTTSVTGLKTVVTAIGAGVGVWGVINLLEEMAANSGSLDLDENFYGDQDFDLEEFDQEGFDMGGGEGSAAPFEEEKF